MNATCPECGGQTKALNRSHRVCLSIQCDAPPFEVEDLDDIDSEHPTLRRLPPDTRRDLAVGVI